MRALFIVPIAAALSACSDASRDVGANDASATDEVVVDAPSDGSGDVNASDADAGIACFESTGVWGTCISTTDCAALGAYTSTPGLCPGPTDIQCCAKTPDVADNPPIPSGWKLMAQADVTAAMTSWAVAILKDPVTYPMFSTTTQTFGTLLVMARVEWHPPDFQNGVVHRGVTLYEPI